MEDFATIIWLLVVIGAAIASRSRRACSRSMEPEPSGTERTRPRIPCRIQPLRKRPHGRKSPDFPIFHPQGARTAKECPKRRPCGQERQSCGKGRKHRPAGQKQGSASRKRGGIPARHSRGMPFRPEIRRREGQTPQAPCARRRRYRGPRSMRPPRPKSPQISTSAGPLYMQRS